MEEKIYVCVRDFNEEENELLGKKFTLDGWKYWLLHKELKNFEECFSSFDNTFKEEYKKILDLDKKNIIDYIQESYEIKLIPLENEEQKYLITDATTLITETQLREMVLKEELDDIKNNSLDYVSGELNLEYQLGCIRTAINSDIYEVLAMANSSWNIPIIQIW